MPPRASPKLQRIGRHYATIMSMRVALPLIWLLAGVATAAADLPAGQVIDRVECAADPSQSYALFVPANYSSSRLWPVIFAFDPAGRGRTPVERYQAAAERYGYIVVGSNNSRNGSTEIPKILAAMTADVAERLAVDPRRVYLAGMSGGARVALGIALASKNIAGVIASSAGYPDSRVRKTLPFPLFATAGTEDFNHLEMRRLDRELSTPHRLAIFTGGHVWLSSDLALQAVEWMELHAMKSGLKPKDDAVINGMYESRSTSVETATGDIERFRILRALADDFQGLKDVSAISARAAELGRDTRIRAALDAERDEDLREESMLRDMTSMTARLTSDDRLTALNHLRQRWRDLSAQAKNPIDSTQRQIARRVLGALSADGTNDEDYAKIIAEYRLPRTPR